MSTAPHTDPEEKTPRRSAILWYASIFVVFVCIALVAMESWFAWTNRKNDLLAAKVAAANLTQALTQHAEDTVKKADTALFGLLERIEVYGISPSTLQSLYPLLVEQVAEMPELQGIFVFDENGRWLINSMDNAPGDTKNNADRAYFIHHRDSTDRTPYIGAPIRSKTTGDWIIPISRRINHPDGSFAGVVAATIKMDYFQHYYSRFDIGEAGTIVLALNDATVLVRRPYVESMIGQNIAGGTLFSQYIHHRANDTQILRSSLDHTERVVSYHSLQRYPLIVVTSLSKKEVLAAWRERVVRQGIGVFLLAGIIALLGLRLIKQIHRHDMTEQALSRAQQKVLAVNKTLQRLALQDALTGLANRRQFDLTLNSEYDRAVREQRSIALLMIDVDYFKRYNDVYGHPQGDICLAKVADAMQTKRPGDFSARYGGEEFAVILTETDIKGAMIVAEIIRKAIRGLNMVHSGNPTGFVTISIGVCVMAPSSFSHGPPAFLQAADEALYMAKGAGRNMVCAYEGSEGDASKGKEKTMARTAICDDQLAASLRESGLNDPE
ncbi:MAG TPA: sensor domain-containing diguanylate cyclase [Herbaspirillum sp.]|jgi:diguanylate cyclase (GGDEF)-like protein